MPEPDHIDLPEVALAIRFHDTYERLAPSFGYETRKDTQAFDPTTPNGRLMTAVCKELLSGGSLEWLEFFEAHRTHTPGIPWLPGGASGAAMPEIEVGAVLLLKVRDNYGIAIYSPDSDYERPFVDGWSNYTWSDIAYFARINAPQGGTVGGSDA